MKALIQKILVVCLMVAGVAGEALGKSGNISGSYDNLTIDGNATINEGVTVTVTGNLYIKPNGKSNINLTVNGTLKVGGSIYLQKYSYTEYIVITKYTYGNLINNGTIESTNIDIQNEDNTFTNNGTLTATGNVTNGGTFTSNGTMTANSISNSDNFTNNGTLMAKGNVTNGGTFTSNGTMTANSITNNKNKSFTNKGPLTILGNLENNGTLTSSKDLKIPSSLTGNGTIDMTGATNPKLTVGSANSTITVKMGNNAQISANSGDLKLGSVTVGTNSSIHTAGSLTTTGGTIGDNTSLSIGKNFTNGSTLTLNENLDVPGDFTNNGTITIQDVSFRVGSYDDNNMAVSDAGGDVVNNGTININTSQASANNGDYAYLISKNLTNNGTINLNSGYVETKEDLTLNLDSKINYQSGTSGILVYGDMFQDGSGIIDIFTDNAKIRISDDAEGMLVVAGTYKDEGWREDHPWKLDESSSENIGIPSNFNLAVNSYDYAGAYGLVPDDIVKGWQNNGVFADNVETLTKQIQETLPIELVYFRAQQDDGNVEFTWQTASELNNDYFTIEYSFNAVDFEELAIVAGAGTTTETVDYQYTEFSANYTGTVYYRLKQTDYDGEFSYSDMIALTFAEKDFDEEISAIIVYPNPATDIINVDGQFERIAVCDFQGRVLSVAPKGEKTLNVSNLPSGTYYVKVTTEGEQRLIPFVKR